MYSFDIPESYSAMLKLNMLLAIFTTASSSVLALKGLLKQKKKKPPNPQSHDSKMNITGSIMMMTLCWELEGLQPTKE